MTSHSQSGQDRFVDAILDGNRDGLFLDVGANHPVEISNTYELESELGWRGVLVDRDAYCADLCAKQRKNPFLLLDGLTADWEIVLGLVVRQFEGAPRTAIDYLSLDCDENTATILERILAASGPRFRVMTVETDLYSRGPLPRDRIRRMLAGNGYDILCRDVRASDGSIYEEWVVDPNLVDMARAERFRSYGLKWEEIMAKI